MQNHDRSSPYRTSRIVVLGIIEIPDRASLVFAGDTTSDAL